MTRNEHIMYSKSIMTDNPGTPFMLVTRVEDAPEVGISFVGKPIERLDLVSAIIKHMIEEDMLGLALVLTEALAILKGKNGE